MGLLERIEAAARPPERKASTTWPILAASGGGGPRFMDRRFEQFADEGYRKNVIAYRSISMVAQAGASVPYRVLRDDEELTDGELPSLVRRPNPWVGWSSLIEAFIAYYLIAGDAYLEAVGPDRGLPRELYVLRPDRVSIKLNKQLGAPEAYIWKVGSGEHTFPVDPITGASTILHWQTFNPLDPWNGQSPVDPAAFSIDQHNAAGKWNATVLQNSAIPSGALVYAPKEGPGELTEEQFLRLRRELDTKFSGAANAGRPMLLEDGMTWQAMSLSQRDTDWLKGKNVSAREIGLAYGVPAQLLGIPDAQTFSNHREARLAFWEDTVIPLVGRAKDALNTWFAQWWPDLRLVCDLTDVPAMTLQQEHHVDRIVKLVESMVYTPNEAREELGKEPVEGGDSILVPANLFPLGDDGATDDDDDKLLQLPRGGLGREDAERLARLAYGTPRLIDAAD